MMVRRVRLIGRAALMGKWRFVRFMSLAILYGMTHRKCRQCGYIKGLSSSPICGVCSRKNIFRGLLSDDV